MAADGDDTDDVDAWATADVAVALAELAALGSIPVAYRHHRRVVAPGAPLALPGALLKWYELHREGVAVPEALRRAAREHLRAQAEAGALDVGYGLGFVVLHSSATHAYLIVGAWQNNQELWETLYIRELVGDESIQGFHRARPGWDAPTLCVWELAPVWHEREAWVRYLCSARDEAAKRAYLADHLAGQV
jgi:hypothetical protein